MNQKEQFSNVDENASSERNKEAKVTVKRNYKDSVFCLYFREPENALDFYKMLHPDQDVGLEDIKYISSESVFVNGFVNDIGFTINGLTMILVEEQSTWTDNIVGRGYLYQAKFHLDYFSTRNKELHMVRATKFPKPEIYSVYTGTKDVPDEVSLADTYFDGDTSFLECKIRIIKNPAPETALSQYISFCKTVEEIRNKGKLTKEHLKGIIDNCIEKNIMKKFLQKHRGEVLSMMEGYHNEEEIRIALQEEHDEILTESVTKSVTESVTKSVTESVTKSVRNEDFRRYVHAMKNNGLDAVSIAKLLEEPLESVDAIVNSN
ncbi:MAG: hypothetical protein KBS81_01865 [Spirochaetales bacterium]|nr:hypothetical protein [Candidatus Physcosoma equi]